MPDFVELTKYVIEFFDPAADSEIMLAFSPWLDGRSAANLSSAANVPLDQIFNLLHLEYGKDEVNALVTKRLMQQLIAGADYGREHGYIKRISSSQSGTPQVVTTNFDKLFELGGGAERLSLYVPPVFPDLKLGANIEGVTYLHGRLADADSESNPYVLSSADFGRAYLAEGWATNFVRNLLEKYTVVLVGYKAEDPPVKYLLQGLNHDGQYDRSRLYAFDRGLPEEIEVKWRDRGVTAIAYSNYSDLWQSMEAWADRADDPRSWRASVIAKSQQDPKELTPHERGQVAHVLRTAQGAKLFSEADPVPHPEWVCVMDASIRSAQKSQGYGDDAEVFDPVAVYGLDDDLGGISEDERRQGLSNDNLLVWRDGDDSPHDAHQLGEQQAEGFEVVPKRLSYLINWMCKCIDSPVLAWWAIRQSGLHPRLLRQLECKIEQSTALHERARRIWRLILEYQDPRNRQTITGWHGFKSRVQIEGWTTSVLREFRRIATPQLVIERPFGLAQSRPPHELLERAHLRNLGEFEVAILKQYSEDLYVPDDVLPQVFSIFEEQLIVASGLLKDIETPYFNVLICYPGREVDGREFVTKPMEALPWFITLFDRLAANRPELARAHAMTWSAADQFFFRKLELYALSKVEVFEADYVAEKILSLDQEVFWDSSVVRELLFLLVDRWSEFSLVARVRLLDRVLVGPDDLSDQAIEEACRWRNIRVARYARYLELQGCELTANQSEQLAKVIDRIPDWCDSRARSLVGRQYGPIETLRKDETPDVLLSISVTEVVSRAKEDSKRDHANFIDHCPFDGLVKTNPRKALSALTIAGKAGDYPAVLWLSMVSELPAGVRPRLRRVFLARIARLPHTLVAELSHGFARWLKKSLVSVLEFDDELGWAVYDHIVDGILSGGAGAVKSGLGDIFLAGKVIPRSRRTFDHAINSPVGMCVEALLHAMPEEKQEAGSLIPGRIRSRIERFWAAPGEGSDHAMSIMSNNLNWLMFVDPAWTEERLVPILAFEHPASEAAWNGFLYGVQPPQLPLAEVIKPLLLDLFPRVEKYSWDQELSVVAAQWLGWLRVFHPDERGGLSQKEMRSILRAMSDDTRNRFIFWLGQIGKKNENGWIKYVIPLINEVWPKERRYRTSASMRGWFGLLDGAGDHFPVVYDAVKKFLVPSRVNEYSLWRLSQEREAGDKKTIAAKFPESVLDLISRTTPRTLTHLSYELPKALALIVEAEPDLASDSRYLHLTDLIERS